MAVDRIGRVEDINCVNCGMSKHTLCGTCKALWQDDDVSAGSTYDLLQCNGCQRATLRDTYWFSKDPGEESATFWPPRTEKSRTRLGHPALLNCCSTVGALIPSIGKQSPRSIMGYPHLRERGFVCSSKAFAWTNRFSKDGSIPIKAGLSAIGVREKSFFGIILKGRSVACWRRGLSVRIRRRCYTNYGNSGTMQIIPSISRHYNS